jgi:hypothetical protein
MQGEAEREAKAFDLSGSPYGHQIEPVSRPEGLAQRSRLERAASEDAGLGMTKPGSIW